MTKKYYLGTCSILHRFLILNISFNYGNQAICAIKNLRYLVYKLESLENQVKKITVYYKRVGYSLDKLCDSMHA